MGADVDAGHGHRPGERPDHPAAAPVQVGRRGGGEGRRDRSMTGDEAGAAERALVQDRADGQTGRPLPAHDGLHEVGGHVRQQAGDQQVAGHAVAVGQRRCRGDRGHRDDVAQLHDDPDDGEDDPGQVVDQPEDVAFGHRQLALLRDEEAHTDHGEPQRDTDQVRRVAQRPRRPGGRGLRGVQRRLRRHLPRRHVGEWTPGPGAARQGLPARPARAPGQRPTVRCGPCRLILLAATPL